jgi:hypothetical protein
MVGCYERGIRGGGGISRLALLTSQQGLCSTEGKWVVSTTRYAPSVNGGD